MGRPSTYSEATADAICERLMLGEPLRRIAGSEGMPEEATIYRWLASIESFREKYTRAKEVQADRFAEELVEIADDATNDWMEAQGEQAAPGYALNGEHIQRSKLRVEARKWLMGKHRPKVYGDSQKVEHTGSVTIQATSLDEKL